MTVDQAGSSPVLYEAAKTAETHRLEHQEQRPTTPLSSPTAIEGEIAAVNLIQQIGAGSPLEDICRSAAARLAAIGQLLEISVHFTSVNNGERCAEDELIIAITATMTIGTGTQIQTYTAAGHAAFDAAISAVCAIAM